MRKQGRYLVLGLLVASFLIGTTSVAEAAWPAAGGGSQRGLSIAMPAGQAPTATRTGLGFTNTVVIPRPLIHGTTYVSAFNVYRSTNGGSLVSIGLSSCTWNATYVTCLDSFTIFTYLSTYAYAVRPRQGTNWVGLQSSLSTPPV